MGSLNSNMIYFTERRLMSIFEYAKIWRYRTLQIAVLKLQLLIIGMCYRGRTSVLKRTCMLDYMILCLENANLDCGFQLRYPNLNLKTLPR